MDYRSYKEDLPFTKYSKNIDGRALALALKTVLIKRIDDLQKDHGVRPGLAIVRVGDNQASQIYVTSKKSQCSEIGIRSFEHYLSEKISQSEIISLVHNMNDDPEIHGIIIQLPLPKGFDQSAIIQSIHPSKDVDGLHPLNLGKLFSEIEGGFLPCTPKGCIRLIHSVQKNIKGLHAVVVGTSNLVGKPLAHLLLQNGCSVSLLNSNTKNPKILCQKADILAVATGVPHLVQADWVKEKAIVIDVGMNRLAGGEGDVDLVGDVNYAAVHDKVKAITPVPGGVGPMTVACLLENTVTAAENAVRLR